MPENKSKGGMAIMVGSVIILFFSVVSFVFVPAMADFRGGAPLPLGKFRGKKIEDKPGSLFNLSYSSVKNQQNSSDEYSLLNSAFEQTVLFMSAFDSMKKAGFTVPETAIRREMLPYFSDEDGNYSARAFADASRAQKAELHGALEKNLLYQQFCGDFLGKSTSFSASPTSFFTGIKASDAETQYIADIGKKLRKIDYAAFSFSDYPADEAVSFAKSSEENTALFSKCDMSVVTLFDESGAKALQKQVALGAVTFEDAVASENSQKIYSDESGKLTDSFRFQMKKIVPDDAALSRLDALEQNMISEVVATANGWSFFRKDGAEIPADFSDQKTIDAVVSYVKENEAEKIEEFVKNRAQDFANDAAISGFEAACENAKVSKQTTENGFALNYHSNSLVENSVPASGDLSGADTDENFLLTIFQLKDGEISKPILLEEKFVVASLAEESDRKEEDNSQNWLWQYFPMQYDRESMQDAVLKSDDVQNNVSAFYTKYYIQNN